MKSYEFHLHVSSTQYLQYYRGTVKTVIAACTDGQTIQFPAALLQKFLAPGGINGKFILTSQDNNKGLELRKVE